MAKFCATYQLHLSYNVVYFNHQWKGDLRHDRSRTDKMTLLKQMHKYVIDIGDEDLYWYWITEAVPDEPDDDIYEFIATHEELWLNCCEVFHKIYLASKEEE